MIKAIILDDEYAAGKHLEEKLRQQNRVEVLAVLHDSSELMVKIDRHKPEVIFMDIDMPGQNGIQLAVTINQLSHPPLIVYVTAHSHYAINAFKVNAVDYLLKPVVSDDLDKTVDKLEARITLLNTQLSKHLKKEIHANVLGNLRIFQESKETVIRFKTAKCEELLCFILLNSQQKVSKWQIIDLFWPKQSISNSEASLRSTVYRLNQSFSEIGLDLKVKADKSNYYLSSPVIISDLDELSRITEDELYGLIMNDQIDDVMSLYPGDLLKFKYYSWTSELQSYYSSLIEDKILKVLDRISCISLPVANKLLGMFPYNDQVPAVVLDKIMKCHGSSAVKRLIKSNLDFWKENELHIGLERFIDLLI